MTIDHKNLVKDDNKAAISRRNDMSNKNYGPVCGLYCGECEFLGKQCQGCGHVDGKPFWTAHVQSGVCPIHDCCRNRKQLDHCGLCPDFPCKTFLELRDPNMSDEVFEASLATRQASLRKRAEIGTEQWLLDISGS
jgi:Protein of unknown function (DUF3795)